MNYEQVIDEIILHKDDEYRKWVEPILQINDGGYGNGDKLYGVRVPYLRKIAKTYADLGIDDVVELLHNEYHEVRLTSLFILLNKYKRNPKIRDEIINIYLHNIKYINNWDLVDMTAPQLLGSYIYEYPEKVSILEALSNSKDLWKERIAIVATLYFIKNKSYIPTIKLAKKYLKHEHHLIHKATGWMLREIGKSDINELYSFLDRYFARMPRVMLRYAIERLDEQTRKKYMMS